MKFPPALVVFCFVSSAHAAFTSYSQDFELGLDGWTAGGSGTSYLVHNFVEDRASYLDVQAGIGYYLAPTVVLGGDLSGAYDGVFSFDLIVPDGMDVGHNNTNLIHADLFIWGHNQDVLVLNASQPADGFSGEATSHFSFTINPAGGWGYFDANTSFNLSNFSSSTLRQNVYPLTVASEEQIRAVLASVRQIGLRAEFSDGIDSTAGTTPDTPGFNPETELDNFHFGQLPGAPVPEPSVLGLLGLANLAWLRRKRS